MSLRRALTDLTYYPATRAVLVSAGVSDIGPLRERFDTDEYAFTVDGCTATLPGAVVRYARAGGDMTALADAVREAINNATVERRYLSRTVPRLGAGTVGYARRRR